MILNGLTNLKTIRCKKLPEEGGDGVLHLLGNGRADGEAEAEGDQVDVGAQLVAQSANLDADLLPNLTTPTGCVAQSDHLNWICCSI